jgi:hypothetical protein
MNGSASRARNCELDPPDLRSPVKTSPLFQKLCTFRFASCTHMCYTFPVNQPKLITGRQPVTSRGKGNPMKDHARHVPGSTRSRRPALSGSFPFFLPSLLSPKKSVQNPYKSDHLRECEFFNTSASTTYNFNMLKCTDFPAPLAVVTSLHRRPHSGGASSVEPAARIGCPSLSLGERDRVRDKPVRLRACPLARLVTNFKTLYGIVEIGDLADFPPIRPRGTKYLRKSKSACADFLPKPFSGKNRNFPESGSFGPRFSEG